MKLNFNLLLKYGLIGGFMMIIISFVTYLFYQQLFSSFWMQSMVGLLYLAVIIFIPVWGSITYRREMGGFKNFGEAFLAVFIIYGVTMACGTIIGYVIPNWIDREYPVKLLEKVKNTTQEQMEKWGAPESKIEETMAQMNLEKFQPTVATSLISYGKGLLWGVLLSLIIAAFVKRNKQTVVPLEESSMPAP